MFFDDDLSLDIGDDETMAADDDGDDTDIRSGVKVDVDDNDASFFDNDVSLNEVDDDNDESFFDNDVSSDDGNDDDTDDDSAVEDSSGDLPSSAGKKEEHCVKGRRKIRG